jgi:surfactin family lipopeptide synthetase C
MDCAIPVRDRETSVNLEQAYASWNATSTVYQSDTSIHQLFERWAERTPASPALVCGDRRLSYGELNSKANRLAHYLKSLGVGPGSLVGVCLHRSLELIVAILGTLKVGAAYVPLDPAYLKKRLAAMIGDIQLLY